MYRCGALFHESMAKYFTALNSMAAAGDIYDARVAAREAGVAYNAALVALLKRLNSIDRNAESSREAERAERAISLLSFEIQSLSDSR